MSRLSNRILSPTLAALVALSCGGGQKPTTNIVMEPEHIVAKAPVEPEPPVEPAKPKPPAEPLAPVLEFPKDDYRAKQPAAGPARQLQLPKINRFKLKNGVEVFLAENHVLPTVQASLVFDGGSMNDPVGKTGLASVCVNTMQDSTESLDKVALAEQLADMASNVFAGAGQDQQSVGFASLSKNLDATADLWVELLTKPGFRQEDFARNVANAKSSLKQRKGSAGGVAGYVWGSIYYGAAHPFGRMVTDATYDAITLDDCKQYAKDYFKPQGARLFVVGDITKPQVEELMNRRLGKWTGKPKATPKPPKPAPLKGKIFFIDVPGSPQSTITMAHPGPDRKSPDFVPTSLVGSILGGGFASRLNMNIREDKGYAYGANGGFGYSKWYGRLSASAQVRSDATDKSLIEMYKEINGLATGEVTDEELGREKDNMILSLPADFETASDVLGAFQALVYYGLPLDYYKTYVAKVEKADKKAVNAAAHKYLKPGELIILVVGDKATVLPGLQKLVADKALGEGALVILDENGAVVP